MTADFQTTCVGTGGGPARISFESLSRPGTFRPSRDRCRREEWSWGSLLRKRVHADTVSSRRKVPEVW
ncbi:hypothetical protein C8R42DRAFT_177413 [Lentinula raphanica]|nr:hypothetical protein C8R42DRAFT_177413 [Lentinula raphanica]